LVTISGREEFYLQQPVAEPARHIVLVPVDDRDEFDYRELGACEPRGQILAMEINIEPLLLGSEFFED
jgi:hypothetical protein